MSDARGPQPGGDVVSAILRADIAVYRLASSAKAAGGALGSAFTGLLGWAATRRWRQFVRADRRLAGPCVLPRLWEVIRRYWGADAGAPDLPSARDPGRPRGRSARSAGRRTSVLG